jgi:predicted TIM-barrel fold metal-dependent hydrolase
MIFLTGENMKIDAFAHIMTPKYTELYRKVNPIIEKRIEYVTPPVIDLGVRLRLMERYPDVLQMLTVANIPLETFAPNDSVELARIANDEVTELVLKYPNKFFGAAACLPMIDMEAALKEFERAITKNRMNGCQIYSRINGEPLDLPKFKPLYQMAAKYDVPIWIHPATYDKLDNDIGIFSWPFESTSAMYKLVMSGIFHELPNLKFIIHHAGAMVPFFGERIKWVLSLVPNKYPNLPEKFKNFYVDTAVYGNTPSLMCAYEYYGADHMLFGTDAPLGPRWGMVEDTIESIQRMNIPETDKQKIFKLNAINMFKMAL